MLKAVAVAGRGAAGGRGVPMMSDENKSADAPVTGSWPVARESEGEGSGSGDSLSKAAHVVALGARPAGSERNSSHSSRALCARDMSEH